ncbi:recombinase family protein [Streptomyces sp. MAR4 CNX-425]|uniref:recombinase family protein n=1 Tax=Streptomyces sp. MAR4 CNX-425 TaxID=3406343 RepID=UPI003B506DAD
MSERDEVPDTRTLAFIYDRHATTATAALDERTDRCRRYAAAKGWTVAGTWVDRGDHALTDAPRPQWAALALAMRQAAAPAVCLVDSWERISRDPERRAVLCRAVRQARGYCATTAGEMDRDPDRDIAAAVVALRGRP